MSQLQTRLQSFKRRWCLIGITAGLIGALIASILFLLLGGWLDLVWELPARGRIAFLVTAAVLGIAFFSASLVRVAWRGRFPLIAGRIDREMGFGGAVLTGCELEEAYGKPYPFASKTSESLAGMAIEHAANLTATASPKKTISNEPVLRRGSILVSLLCFTGLLGILMPEMMRTQWNRFLHPYGGVPRFSNTSIIIEDPEKRVVYGEPLDIRAAVRGEPVDSAELIMETVSGVVETLLMFPEQDSHWRASLSKMTENAVYFVRAGRARSTKHTIEVITVPRIESVRFRVTPPSYTNRSAYEGTLPKEGLSGLPGTIIEVRATSNRPLSRGEIMVSSQPGRETVHVNMTPDSAAASEVHGEFAITASGKFEMQLFDVDGQGSRDKFSGGITLLKDERPMIRIIKPPSRSLATSSVVLPIEIAAEDDYGISRVQLFRSLNDSRPLATSLPLPSLTPRRYHGRVELPLPEYDLKPGDAIKLFARVEDNDPAGVKGSESSVVLVEIISQEQFEQMVRAKNGMELMLSRYREALRRLEAAKEEVDLLVEKLEKLDKDDPASREIRDEIQKLAQRMKNEADAIRKLAQNPLPYDLDEKFSEELEKATKLAESAANEMKNMSDENGLKNESAKDRLREISEKLSGGKKSLDQATTPSLELLAAVLPLKKDENRFLQIVMRQRDLAQRLASLKDREREDDPAVKARMRELEEEQREIQVSLDQLLSDIEEHAQSLPEREEFEELRDTAMKFADEVRRSRADAAMTEAQAGLAGYSGSIGYAKATEAAEILESFLPKCNGMGQCASQAIRFQPGLGDCMNQTLEQLLRDMGFGQGSSAGNGMGGAGYGVSAQRGGPNVGLYGMLPGMSTLHDAQGGGQGGNNLLGKGGTGQDADSELDGGYEATAEGTVGGSTEGVVPLRYRQAVGRYFQRILEE